MLAPVLGQARGEPFDVAAVVERPSAAQQRRLGHLDEEHLSFTLLAEAHASFGLRLALLRCLGRIVHGRDIGPNAADDPVAR